MKDKKIFAIIAIVLGFILGLGSVTYILNKVLKKD
jgi:hypothetical protein